MLSSNQLTNLIGSIYDAALDPLLWPTFIHAAQNCFNAHSASLTFIDLEQPERSLVQFYGALDEINPEYRNRQAEDYWFHGVCRANTAEIVLGTDIIGLSDMRRTALYADIADPFDAEYIFAAKIKKEDGNEAVTAFIRSKSAGNYDARDKQAFSFLIPHLQKAHFIHTRISAASTLGDALDQSTHGIVVLNCAGHAIFVNQCAEQYFQAEDGLSLCFGLPRLGNHRNQLELEQLITEASATSRQRGVSSGGVVRAQRPSGRLPYQIVVSPLSARSDQINLMQGASCLLFIHDPTTTPNIKKETLQARYGLTQAESQLCVLLYSGNTLAESADLLEITRNTAGTHLKRIFAKCRVNSQVALVRLLALGVK